MKTILLFLLVLISCELAVADSCPGCSAAVLRTDAFCAGCGYDISAWRKKQRIIERQTTTQNVPRMREDVQPQIKSLANDLSEYSYSGTMAYYMHKSDVVTPIKLSLIGKLALPWDDECTVYGLQLGALGGACHTIYGFNICCIGNMSHTFGGISCGLFNICHEANGIQIGFYNSADVLRGLQIGVANYADPKNSIGVQIGAFNTFKSGFVGDGWFFPIINVCF